MAKTRSTMRELGAPAPEFDLPDTGSGERRTFDDIAGTKATVVMFICNHCPFVKHILDGLVAFGNDYAGKDVGIVAISANDITGHPQDAPDRMKELARDAGFPFPYLYDESQDTARAPTTPPAPRISSFSTPTAGWLTGAVLTPPRQATANRSPAMNCARRLMPC